ncbi:MAG: hypothetical protein GX766_09360 [Firmicutes bacterium]|nr:hypothetical protein [Bacillota bacterium]HOB21221.1 S24 family peptidase [Bacillota bacterium]HQD40977.1 S24 family peptidase [Bacillota bacterium]
MCPYKRVDSNEHLERMARAIRRNPEITVQELKDLLGYAQEKSIYYWLQKHSFKGIKHFRRAVLTGAYPPGYPLPADHPSRSAEGLAKSVPLATGFTPQGEVNTSEHRVPVLLNCSESAFAYHIDTNEYLPTIAAGDFLIVEPEQQPQQGSLVLVLDREKPLLYRFYPGQPPLLVHPANPHHAKKHTDSLVLMGQVVQLLRLFA